MTETLTKETALLPLTDVLDMTVPGENATIKDKIIPGFLDTLATNPYGDGVTYYAPMFYSPCGLFYNAGLFKEKGWDVPTTWEEMWALGETEKADGIALFTYPTTGYFDAFTYATLSSAGGSDFFNSCMIYEDGIWESENATKVFELIAKLGEYTEGTTVANANNDNFTKNQQLILDNKAIFCPNGTWLPGEMADAPRTDGFEWGFMAISAVNEGGAGCSFCWFDAINAGAKSSGKLRTALRRTCDCYAANINSVYFSTEKTDTRHESRRIKRRILRRNLYEICHQTIIFVDIYYQHSINCHRTAQYRTRGVTDNACRPCWNISSPLSLQQKIPVKLLPDSGNSRECLKGGPYYEYRKHWQTDAAYRRGHG